VGDYTPLIGLHCLRHNLVQLWLRYGINLQAQQTIRGHLSQDLATWEMGSLR
jgi:hypothetical protein